MVADQDFVAPIRVDRVRGFSGAGGDGPIENVTLWRLAGRVKQNTRRLISAHRVSTSSVSPVETPKPCQRRCNT